LESVTLAPLDEVDIDSWLAALPKADLHIHQEQSPRIDRVLARAQGRSPYDWPGWAARLMAENAPGMARLQHIGVVLPNTLEADASDSMFMARVADLLEEAAADSAVLVEVRFGNDTILRPNFMELFREAERQVRQRYPQLRAEAIATLLLWLDPERLDRIVAGCLQAANAGLRGIDLLYQPYDTEADWTTAYRIAEQAAAAGLGVTAHAGEISTANIAAALRTPGLTRIGHATYAAADPRLLPEADALAKEAAPELVRRPWSHLEKAVEALADDHSDDALHQVRIRAKRCRYAAEAVAPVIGKPATRLASAVAEVQTVLGDWHDAVVAEEWLRHAVQGGGTAAKALAAGQLIAIERAEAAALRGSWRSDWKKVSSKKLREWLR